MTKPIHAAGIYVADADPEAVWQGLREYWAQFGAYEDKHPPESSRAFDLKRTSQIGFILHKHDSRSLLLDSERYTANPQLAAFLFQHLRVEIIAFCLSESIGKAWWTRYSATSTEHIDVPSEIKRRIQEFPDAFAHMPSIKQRDPTTPGIFFAGIEERSGVYSGAPNGTREARNRQIRRGQWYRQTLQLEPFRQWLLATPKSDTLLGDLHCVDLTSSAARSFVLALEPQILKLEESPYKKRAREALAKAAFWAGHSSVLKRLDHPISSWTWGRWLTDFATAKRFDRALDAFQHLMKCTPLEEVESWAWNNLCHSLCHLPPEAAGADLPIYLEKITQCGADNSAIYHNLACLHLRLGDNSAALDAVEAAIRVRYEKLQDIRSDPDFRPLHAERRWVTAWANFEIRPVEEPEQDPCTLPPCVVHIHQGVTFEGRSPLLFTTPSDDYEDLLGESDPFEAAHGTFRYDDVGLGLEYGDDGFIVHRRDASATLKGIDLFGPLAPTIATLEEKLGPPTTNVRENFIEYRFERADIIACGRIEPPKIVSIIVRPKGGVAEEIERESRKRRERRASAEREALKASESRDEALTQYFKRLDEPQYS